jgi:regulator of sirC expression with transglutaminase-like and TPR domain
VEKIKFVSDRAIFWIGSIGAIATISLVHTVTIAATAPEIANTARAITVKISEPGSQGSGVILQHQGNVYTVLTAAHVVRDKSLQYTVATPDSQKYALVKDSIRLAKSSIDLAVVKFSAATNYPTAKLGNCNLLSEGMDLYVAGYPVPTKAITDSVFVFRPGTVSANSNKTFANGYSLVYSNDTLPGMSGGAVLNKDGELVAIHGRGDREINTSGDAGVKTGYNLGIPINRFAAIASNLGVNLSQKVAAIPQTTTPKADDYYILAWQKSDEGNYRGALAEFDRAIQLKSNYAAAYNDRGLLKEFKLNDIQGALSDYNRAIQSDAKYAGAYINRANLKEVRLNDYRGALVDYDRGIELNPNLAAAYYNRGELKQRMKDYRSALSDYNRAIQLDSEDAQAYGNRGYLKYEKLGDRSGGIQDMKKAARIFRERKPTSSNVENYKNAMGQLKQWGIADEY